MVLRIKIDESYSDTWNGEPGNTGFQTTYVFMHPGANYLLLTINIPEFESSTFSYMSQEVVSVSEDLAADVKLHAYPNPAQDLLNIPVSNKDQNCNIQMFNSIGQCVYNQNSVLSNGSTIQLDLHTFENGIYTIHVCQGSEILTDKVLVAH